MKILIADDQIVNRKLLRLLLESEGYDTHETLDGPETLSYLETVSEPLVGLIDWEMPSLVGTEVCRQIRLRTDAPPLFLILLTVRDQQADINEGLGNGANDYVTKPFDKRELLARIKIGVQMVELQHSLQDQVKKLSRALEEIKELSGLLPICSYCKSIRNDQNYWQRLESYFCDHAQVQFTHGVCPDCMDKHVLPQLDAMDQEGLTPEKKV